MKIIISYQKSSIFNFINSKKILPLIYLWLNKIDLLLFHCFKSCSTKEKSKNPSWGFTLIEVLITLMIIGILVATLMPNVAKIQNKAKEVSVKNIGHQLQLAIEGYYLSEGQYPDLQNVGIEELSQALMKTGDLKALPKNPFTNMGYSNQDASGGIRYTTEQNGYRLMIMGVENKESILVLSN